MSSANILPGGSEGPVIRAVHDIASVQVSGTEGGRMAEQGAMRPLLTRRRAVDYCRVATALCPAMPRQGVLA